MDRSIAFYLVEDAYTADTIGQYVPTQTKRLVYGRINAITRAEWNAAGELGIKPDYQITMFGPDYKGEKTVEMVVGGKTQYFGIYRTYQTLNDDLELYLEWKVGDSNGTVISTASTEPTSGGSGNGTENNG